MIGNRSITGTKHHTDAVNRRFGPSQSTAVAKNSTWIATSTIPYNASHKPIEAGVKPRPPREVGVEKKRGKRALREISRKDSMP
jgi:hypothetical protein